MDAVIRYFEALPDLPTHRAAYLFGGLFVFFLIENARPLFRSSYNKTNHTATNIFFTLTTVMVNFLMAGILTLAAVWVETNAFGLLHWWHASNLTKLIVGLMLLDLIGAYAAHWIEHHVQWMWQFHVIHHTDQHVDTTTANRHHPGESVIRFLFTTVAVLLIGPPIWLIFLYQTLSVILTQFNHSNLKIPNNIDRLLRLVLCTPNMHRSHHHYRQPYSDSNYGNIFSVWDRMFGTYIIVDNTKLIYGVDTYMDKEEASNVLQLLKMPFKGYRTPVQYEKEEEL
jgi:sterol desaturase/sphingolipid hydroxylase (fatty acid hydroxylase superfamily)